MSIARKFMIALLSCVVVAVVAYATVSARAELRRSGSDIVEYESFTAHPLRPAVPAQYSFRARFLGSGRTGNRPG